jgi:hypothetical protein
MAAAALPIMAATGVYSAVNANRNQKKATSLQQGIAKNQNQLFQQTTPYYGAILQYLAQNAGINLPQSGVATPARYEQGLTGPKRLVAGTGSPAGTPTNALASSPLPSGSGALPDSYLGVFGQNEQDRLAFGQAEEDLGRQRERREQQLRFRLGQRGAGEATISSAMAQNEGDYQSQLAAFRRQIALAARAEQERRVAQLLGAMNPGLGQGAAASAAFGQNAAMYGGQANAAGAGLGSFLSNWLLADAMRRQGAGGIAGTAGTPYDPLQEMLRQSTGGTYPGSWTRG